MPGNGAPCHQCWSNRSSEITPPPPSLLPWRVLVLCRFLLMARMTADKGHVYSPRRESSIKSPKAVLSGFSLRHRTQKSHNIYRPDWGQGTWGLRRGSICPHPSWLTAWEAGLGNVQSWTFELEEILDIIRPNVLLSKQGVEEQRHEIMDSPLFHTEGLKEPGDNLKFLLFQLNFTTRNLSWRLLNKEGSRTIVSVPFFPSQRKVNKAALSDL